MSSAINKLRYTKKVVPVICGVNKNLDWKNNMKITAEEQNNERNDDQLYPEVNFETKFDIFSIYGSDKIHDFDFEYRLNFDKDDCKDKYEIGKYETYYDEKEAVKAEEEETENGIQ